VSWFVGSMYCGSGGDCSSSSSNSGIAVVVAVAEAAPEILGSQAN
jgi:hypothetical protein